MAEPRSRPFPVYCHLDLPISSQEMEKHKVTRASSLVSKNPPFSACQITHDQFRLQPLPGTVVLSSVRTTSRGPHQALARFADFTPPRMVVFAVLFQPVTALAFHKKDSGESVSPSAAFDPCCATTFLPLRPLSFSLALHHRALPPDQPNTSYFTVCPRSYERLPLSPYPNSFLPPRVPIPLFAFPAPSLVFILSHPVVPFRHARDYSSTSPRP